MNKKYQNGFLVFGIAVLALMVTQLNFSEVWNGLRRAGYWFWAVMALWLGVYALNTLSWYLIIRQGRAPGAKKEFGFWWLYKVTVSGFALNYATPGGLMGGEAYRIMELAPKIGTERASSSVILYVMTHIFCHFWFWLLSVGLFLVAEPVPIGFGLAILLALITAFCILGLWFFMKGYKKGLAVRLARWLGHLPWFGNWAKRMAQEHGEQLETVDKQIAALHRQNPLTFFAAVVLELAGRFLSCLEIMFVLLVLSHDVDYVDCVVMLAFTSLFANILFFIPLQLGGREGGFTMSAVGLAMTASSGIFVALIVRIREMVWIAVGLLLIKVERKKEVAAHTGNCSLPTGNCSLPTPNNDKK